MKINTAIILAGGLGTRLLSVVADRPKSMALINDRPFMEYLLDFLLESGIENFIFSVGHKSNFITNYFGKLYKNCPIEYAFEAEPLGTGGAILNAMQHTDDEHVLVTNGDSIYKTDIKAMVKLHFDRDSQLTLSLKPMKNYDRYGSIIMDENQRITKFEEKQAKESGNINGGVYIFHVPTLKKHHEIKRFSIERDYFESKVKEVRIYGMVNDAYFLDIGIPNDFEKAQDEFKNIN